MKINKLPASIIYIIMICANLCFSSASADQRGQVTNLPIPRFVSMKAPEGNVRRGPSLSHRVDWIFKQKNTPLKIIAEYGHWRQVVDWEGEGGWMHYSLLSGVRHVLVIEDLTHLLAKPTIGMPINAYLETGVIARLGKCDIAWCKLNADGFKGWALKSSIWGVFPKELRD